MNKVNRKDLQRAMDLISEARSIIEMVQEEEQDKFDNMPEGLQVSENGQKLEENAYKLEEIMDCLEEQESELEDIINE